MTETERGRNREAVIKWQRQKEEEKDDREREITSLYALRQYKHMHRKTERGRK